MFILYGRVLRKLDIHIKEILGENTSNNSKFDILTISIFFLEK